MKDTVTNVCGLIVAVGGALLASGANLGTTLTTVIGIAVAVATAVIGYFTGKKA